MKSQKYTSISREEYNELEVTFRKNKGTITNRDGDEFDFRISTPIGNIEGHSAYLEPILEITITKKPLFTPMGIVFGQIDNLIKRYTQD